MRAGTRLSARPSSLAQRRKQPERSRWESLGNSDAKKRELRREAALKVREVRCGERLQREMAKLVSSQLERADRGRVANHKLLRHGERLGRVSKAFGSDAVQAYALQASSAERSDRGQAVAGVAVG